MSPEDPRVPPKQKVTEKFPVLHVGAVPKVDLDEWNLTIEGLVKKSMKLKFSEVLELPRFDSASDFHCVTGWSRLNNRWEGVSFKTVCDMVTPAENAMYVTIIADGGYTTSLPLADMLDDDVLLAYRLDGKALSPDHGGPLRLVVPKKYAYKSAKWVRRLRFTEEQELGYWEKRGYSNTADPWNEERCA